MNPKQNRARRTEIPPDMEARQQRQSQSRSEYDPIAPVARLPLKRRRRSGALTIVLMAGAGIVLCVLSIGGGILVNGILNRAPDIGGTITGFMDDITAQHYSDAHAFLPTGGQDALSFQSAAETADNTMGQVVKYHKDNQDGGKSGDIIATVTFTVARAGITSKQAAATGFNTHAAASYPSIVIIMNYIGGAWKISDYGSLFACPDCHA